LKIYIDGVSQSVSNTGEGLSASMLNNETLKIGTDTGDTCCVFGGRLDDVRVYNRALTAAEVQDLAAGSCSATAQMDYEPGARKYYMCDGAAWREITCPSGNCGSLGSCAGSGKVDYFPGSGELAWCDGTGWQVMAR
jgi:hypothetical protein